MNSRGRLLTDRSWSLPNSRGNNELLRGVALVRCSCALSVILVFTGMCSALGGLTGAALRADYRFQNIMGSSVPGAPDLVNIGSNTFSPTVVDGVPTTVLSFGTNDGVLFPTSGIVPSGNYSVVVLFKFDETSGWPWQRILDFKNRTTDDGLYAYNGALNFYNVAVGPDAFITQGAWVQVALTRDLSQTVVGYLNGVQQFSFLDTNSSAVMDSTVPLRFFQDDLVYPNEAAPGSVARIRLFDGALSALEVAALDRLAVGNTNNSTFADLRVTKLVDTNALPINSATPFHFVLTVTNLGPGTVTNLALTDKLPAGLAFSSVNTLAYEPSNGLWSVPGPLGPGQGRAIILGARGTSAGTFTNTLTVNVPAGVTDTNLANNSASAVVTVLPVYAISGYVDNCRSNGTPLANITVRLSGAANQVTTTMPGGFYKFYNLSNGVYTITPSQPGNQFLPVSKTITLNNADVTLPTFVGSVGLIYGGVFYFGNALTNHPVRLTGAQARTILTDANGYYIFTNTPAGNYTVTPTATNGYVFAPTNAAVALDATNCAGLANFFALQRTLQLVALEVVQVIQDWSNTVPLIQDKETWVRAHLQLTNASNPVLVQGARLYGTGPAGPLPGSPLSPFNTGGSLLVRTTNAAAGRGQFTNSMNFRLPASWLSGAISLQFVATNNLTVLPTNTVPVNSTVRVSFVPSRPLPLLVFPVNWRRATDGALQQNSANNLADLPRRLLSIYPVPSVNSTLAQPLLAPFTAQPVQANYTALNRQLEGIRNFVQFFVAENRLYHGAVARGGPGISATGEAHLPGFISSALMPNNTDFYSDPWLRHLASHEIGHNLGRPHDITNSVTLNGPCGEVAGAGTPVYPFSQPVPPPAGPIKPALGPTTNGVNSLVYGLDTHTRASAAAINPIADPNADFDVMGYCNHAPLQWWISASTYPAMLTYITNTLVPPAPLPPPGPPRRWLFVRGPIDFSSNTGAFEPFYALNTTSGFSPEPPVPGNYSLRLFDGSGSLLEEIPFTPEADTDETLGAFDTVPETGSFDIPVLESAYPAAVERVELWEAGGTILARQTAGASPPQFTSAIQVTQSSNSVHLAWSAANAVGSVIQYSADGGASWTTLAMDWPGQTYDLDADYLQAATNGIFRVIATDGFSSSEQTNTLPVKVAPHPPGLILNSPLDGSPFIGDQQIFLDAAATDMQDGTLGGTNVQWTSSVDGVLGYGDALNFQADSLSEGGHVITVTAIDSLGLTNSAAVQILVLRQAPPELGITVAENQTVLSWPANVVNYQLESAPDLVSGNWTTVTNTPVAVDAQQTVTVENSLSHRFFRLRMSSKP